MKRAAGEAPEGEPDPKHKTQNALPQTARSLDKEGTLLIPCGETLLDEVPTDLFPAIYQYWKLCYDQGGCSRDQF